MAHSNSNDQWQLSAYESQRSPNELITDDTTVALHEDSYRRDLTCPICLGFLRNAVATTACLHRFCEDCITSALRKCSKECPICRTRLVSRRSLRRDHRIDTLVAALTANTAEEPLSQPRREFRSRSRERHESTERSSQKQSCDRNVVAKHAVGREDSREETSREHVSTAVESNQESTAAVRKVEDDVPAQASTASPCSTNTRKQRLRRECAKHPSCTSCENVAREATGRRLSLRTRVEDRRPESGNCCAECETGGASPTRTPTVAAPKVDVCGKADDSAAASCRRNTTESSHDTFRDQLDLPAITLRPHIDTFLEFPTSPTFSARIPEQAKIGYVCAHVSGQLKVPATRQHRFRMYGASATGELSALPDTMTLKDALEQVRKAGMQRVLYYGPRDPRF
ncbi:hypothetical protein HPB50_020101 [Hyalomma asiaticum]|uniref:Uncharacterized protein n=1 Tax=Hyalomma asiaticum TaxID=266040 RepID=A0ACB7RJX0_HYAAI|nr:hypothetical protein HPB50_020101 [Hyalomma asiaticum]